MENLVSKEYIKYIYVKGKFSSGISLWGIWEGV